jgi:hypothetical protein
MKSKSWMAISTAALAMSALAAHAGAVSPGTLRMTGAAPSGIEKADQRCWWSHGSRHCRWFGYRGRYREYGNPDIYRYGSSNWWHEMDHEERGGRF